MIKEHPVCGFELLQEIEIEDIAREYRQTMFSCRCEQQSVVQNALEIILSINPKCWE